MDITADDLLQPTNNQVTPGDLAQEDTLKVINSELVKMNKKLEKDAEFSEDLKKELEQELKETTTALNQVVKLLREIKKINVKSSKTSSGASFAEKATEAIKPAKSKPRVADMPGGVSYLYKESKIKEMGTERFDAIKKATQAAVGSALSGVLGGTTGYRLLTKGMLADQYEFASEMNKIAFRTQGITDSSYELQKSFRATKDVVKETGFDLGMLQNQVLRGSRRGLKDSQSIAKVGLGLSKLIGGTEQDAVALSETFFDWNQKLGISKTQLGAVSHEIKEMSRYTGVVGENLAQAVKSSERYLEQMRSAGNLTAQAAKNMILIQTESQKLGIDNQIADLATALSSRDDFLKATRETKTLLIMSAQASGEIANLMNGTVTQSKTSIKNLAEGMRNTFKKFAGGFDIKDIGKMTAEQRALADQKLKAATGKGIGEYERLISVFDTAGKGYTEKIADINKELSLATSNEEKLAIERKKQDLALTESMSYSAAFADAAKNASSFEDALMRIQNTMNPKQVEEYNKELASLVSSYSKDLSKQVLAGNKDAIIKAMTISSAEALKKAGGTDFTGQVSSALKSKDLGKLIKIQERMSKEQQKLGIRDATIGDPMERAADQVKILNENFVGYTGSALMWAAQTAGSTGIMAGLLAMIVAQQYFGIESIRAWGDILLTGIKSLGGAKAASTAAGLAIPSTAGLAPLGAGAATAASTGTATAATSAATLSLGTLAQVLGVVLAGVGAITGSFWAAEEAANYFDTSMEELTMGQLYAAKGAGMLTGALNWLTLGLFNHWLGSTGSITKALAQLTEKLPILSLIAAALDIVIGIIYGAYKAIKNLIIGIYDAFVIALKPIFNIISSITDLVMSIISPFLSLNEAAGGTSTILTNVSDGIGMLGTAIGFIFKAIGFLINIVLKPLELAISGIAKILKFITTTVLSPIVEIFNGLKKALTGIVSIITGLFTLDISKMAEGFKNLLGGLAKAVLSFVYAFPIMIWNAFKSLASNEYLGAIFEPFIEVMQPIYDAIMEVGSAFSALFEPLKELFNITSSEGGGFLSMIKTVAEVIGSVLRVALYPVKIAFEAIAGAIKLVLIPLGWLKAGLTFLVDIINKTVSGIIAPFKFLYDILVGHSIVPDLVTSIISWFSKMAVGALSKLIGLKDGLVSIFSGIKSKIAKVFKDGFVATIVSKMKVVKNAVMSFAEPLIKGFKSIGKGGIGKILGVAGKVGAIGLKKIPGIGLLVGAGLAINELMQGNFKNAIKEFTSGLLSMVPGIGTILSFAMDFFGNSIIDSASNLASYIWNKVTNIWDWLWGNEGEAKTSTTASPVSASNSATMTAISDPSTSKSTIKPVSYVSSYEKLRRNQAQESEMSNSPKTGAIHLNELVALNGQQLYEAKRTADSIELLLRLFNTNNSLSGETQPDQLSTRGNTKPRNSPDYHQWQFGKYDQNPSIQVVSTGI